MAPVGVLADFLEVEGRYEGVVEDFLRDELNYIVVKSWDAADEGLRLLRTDVDGRATFLVHPEDSQAKFSFIVDEAAHHAPPSHAIVPLKSTIRVLNGFGKSLEVILPKLRNGYIVPDPDCGRELALENPDAFFLSQSGECFHNVTVTGGKQRSEGPLSMKRELRDVTRLLGELEKALRHEETRALTLGREIKEFASLLERFENEKREADNQAMTSGHLLKQLDSEMDRVSERLDHLPERTPAFSRGARRAGNLIAGRQAEIAALQQKREELETLAASAHEQLAILRDRRDVCGTECLAACRARGHSGRAPSLCRCRAGENRVAGRRNAGAGNTPFIRRSKRRRRKRRAARTENEQIANQLVEFEAERNAGEARDGLLQMESDQVRARLAEIDVGTAQCAASCSIRRVTGAASFPRRRPSSSPMRSTWRRPA